MYFFLTRILSTIMFRIRVYQSTNKFGKYSGLNVVKINITDKGTHSYR